MSLGQTKVTNLRSHCLTLAIVSMALGCAMKNEQSAELAEGQEGNSGVAAVNYTYFTGKLAPSAVVDGHPEVRFVLKMGPFVEQYLDLRKDDLEDQAQALMESGDEVLARISEFGRPANPGDPVVIVVDQLLKRVFRIDGPTEEQCRLASDQIRSHYHSLLVGSGVVTADDGHCGIVLYFETDATLQQFRNQRAAAGQEPLVWVMLDANGRRVRIGLSAAVIGQPVPAPSIGVSN